MIATDDDNLIAQNSIFKAVQNFESSQFSVDIVKLIVKKNNEEDVCHLLKNKAKWPSIILDITSSMASTGHRDSALLRKVTRQLGLPTISTNNVINEWNGLKDVEKQYLINIQSPSHLFPLVIKDIINKHRIKKSIILHDDSFGNIHF